MSVLPKAIYRLHAISSKTQTIAFFRNKKQNHPKCHMDSQRNLNSQSNRKKKSERSHLQVLLHIAKLWQSKLCSADRIKITRNQQRKQRNKPACVCDVLVCVCEYIYTYTHTYMYSNDLDKGAKTTQKSLQFIVNIHMQKMKLDPYTKYKIIPKWDQRPVNHNRKKQMGWSDGSAVKNIGCFSKDQGSSPTTQNYL